MSLLGFEDLSLLQGASFVEDFPLADLLAIVEGTLVPELSVIVVALPQPNLVAIFESPRLQRLAVFPPPFPVAVQFAIQVPARGLEFAVAVVKLSLAMTLAIPETAFAGEFAPGEKLFVRSVGGGGSKRCSR
jgi:hypothetical protein